MSELTEAVIWRFDDLLLDPQRGTLSRVHRDGHKTPVHIGSRALQILCLLLEQRGELVGHAVIMHAVWPNTTVEPSNLTVQVTALRRLLDANGGLGSSIQNVPGRGYRFISSVSAHPVAKDAKYPSGSPGPEQAADHLAIEQGDAARPRPRIRSLLRQLVVPAACILSVAGLSAVIAWSGNESIPRAERTAAPAASVTSRGEEALRTRLSLVVFPFENQGGDGLSDATVHAVTDDVTAELVLVPGFAVRARNSGFASDAQQVGQDLGVRYVLRGSARTVERVLRISAQLVSAETNEHLWAGRFDANLNTIDDVVRQIAWAVRFRLFDIESTRSARDYPSNPDFADLFVRATYSQLTLPLNPQARAEVISLYERALQLDPSSVDTLTGLAEALLDMINSGRRDHPDSPAMLRRAEELVGRAELLRPNAPMVMFVRVYLLGMQRRCQELIPAAQRAVEFYPSMGTPRLWLGVCTIREGRPADAIPHLEISIRVHPRNPQVWLRHRQMAQALIHLARYDEAVSWLHRALASNQTAAPELRGNLHAWIAAARALANRLDEARVSAAEATQLWPTLTVRSFYPLGTVNPAHEAQIARVLEGLRAAGIRDHADEDADAGLVPDTILHTDYQARTPSSAPGVLTIRTPQLADMMDQRRPLVLDTRSWGRSIPGAVGLPGAGIGGSTSDEYQGRLRHKLKQLTNGNRTMPIVTVGWNAERFEGRNLALRLVALGYTEVYWYRGGREAWEVAGLKTSEVASQQW